MKFLELELFELEKTADKNIEDQINFIHTIHHNN